MTGPWQSIGKEAQITPVYRRLPIEFVDNDQSKGIRKYTVEIVSKNKIIVPSYEEAKKLYFQGFFGKCSLTRSEPVADILQKTTTDPSFDIAENPYMANYPQAHVARFKTSYENQLKLFKTIFEHNAEIDFTDLTGESYRLSSHECFFLMYALDCVHVYHNSDQPMTIVELWDYFNRLYPDKFRLEYAAYHYYRSNQWVVRLGTNYGCDFVLYKDGMPFHHSNFMVYVQQTGYSKQLNPLDLMAVNRVANQCVKKVVIVNIDEKNSPDKCDSRKYPTKYLKSIHISECLVERWIPSQAIIAEIDTEQI